MLLHCDVGHLQAQRRHRAQEACSNTRQGGRRPGGTGAVIRPRAGGTRPFRHFLPIQKISKNRNAHAPCTQGARRPMHARIVPVREDRPERRDRPERTDQQERDQRELMISWSAISRSAETGRSAIGLSYRPAGARSAGAH